MIIVDNPFLKEKLELIKSGSKDDKKIAELDALARDFAESKIQEVSEYVGALQQQVDNVRDMPKLSKQYKTLCSLYKETDHLMKSIRQLKKSVRGEIAEKPKKTRKPRATGQVKLSEVV